MAKTKIEFFHDSKGPTKVVLTTIGYNNIQTEHKILEYDTSALLQSVRMEKVQEIAEWVLQRARYGNLIYTMTYNDGVLKEDISPTMLYGPWGFTKTTVV
jgi:hypothetical protein